MFQIFNFGAESSQTKKKHPIFLLKMPKEFWTDLKLHIRRTWRPNFQNWKPIEENKNDTRFGDLKASLVFGETSQSTQHLQLIFFFKQILWKTKTTPTFLYKKCWKSAVLVVFLLLCWRWGLSRIRLGFQIDNCRRQKFFLSNEVLIFQKKQKIHMWAHVRNFGFCFPPKSKN